MREAEIIPPAGTEYDPRMGVRHIIGGIEHPAHPGETCASTTTHHRYEIVCQDCGQRGMVRVSIDPGEGHHEPGPT